MVNWYDVLPPDVARRQIMWERNQSIVRARESNATFKDIAERLGVSKTVVRIAFLKAKDKKTAPPVNEYYEEREKVTNVVDVNSICFKLKQTKVDDPQILILEKRHRKEIKDIVLKHRQKIEEIEDAHRRTISRLKSEFENKEQLYKAYGIELFLKRIQSRISMSFKNAMIIGPQEHIYYIEMAYRSCLEMLRVSAHD